MKIVIVWLCLSGVLFFQNCTPDEIEIVNPQDVDRLPKFPGGTVEMYKFIYGNLKYPKDARDMGISGTVKTMFYVDTSGFLLDIHAISGPGYGLDEEAVRVVELMNIDHRWIPGILNGKKVRVSFILPIKFVL